MINVEDELCRPSQSGFEHFPLRIVILHTSPELTRAAIRIVEGMTGDLSAEAVLMAIHIVPYPLPWSALLFLPVICSGIWRIWRNRARSHSGSNLCWRGTEYWQSEVFFHPLPWWFLPQSGTGGGPRRTGSPER